MFSEIVVIFSEQERTQPPRGLVGALREIYKIRKFRLAFYLETTEQIRVANFRALRVATHREVEKGSYNFLPSPPVVFSVLSRGTIVPWVEALNCRSGLISNYRCPHCLMYNKRDSTLTVKGRRTMNHVTTSIIYDCHGPLLPKPGQNLGKIDLARITFNLGEPQLHL